MTLRKVLIVAYYFPPFGGGGVQRALKFVKYLPEFSWLPVVLTVSRKAAHLRDASLEREIPAGVLIHRTPAPFLPQWLPWRLRNFVARWLLLVDQQLGWIPFAVRRGWEVILQEKVKVVCSTSAPFSSHLVGLLLKRTTGLPWIADFRDPWIGNFSSSFPTTSHGRAAEWLEKRVVETADRITVVSEPMRRALLGRHSCLDPERVLTLPNGYDLADFEWNKPLGQEAERMVIVHSGSFYGRRQTPLHFLQGLQVALNSGSLHRPKVRVQFVGNIDRALRRHIGGLGLSDIVQTSGYLPHRQCIGYLLGADVLLLIVGSGPGSEAVFTGKIFEYLAAGKPVLGLVPCGVAADLIAEAQAGVVVPPENVEAIANQIATLYRKWQIGDLDCGGNPEVITRYDRRRLTRTLAETLDAVSSVEDGR